MNSSNVETLQRADNGPICEPGRNCWRLAPAARAAVLIDGAAYYRAFKRAVANARQRVMVIGWDVNSQTLLEFPDDATGSLPNELGPFLNAVAARSDGPEIRVLCWDSPLIYDLDREWLPQARFDWFTHPRLRFALDDAHPIGASQHQKIVVVDDRIAFCGGFDLTIGRLDDSEHEADDPRRVTPSGRRYHPFHDLMMLVDGEAAAALGTLARERWQTACGELLAPIECDDDPWPEELVPDFTDVEIAIARTRPAWRALDEVREVEALFLDSIAAARDTIYIENQYFACERIVEAMISRLQESDGPEIVVILPGKSSGWLEETTMGRRRKRQLARLRASDQFGRFGAFAPRAGGGEGWVEVHSKVTVIDDRFLRIGSANLNNRSMGLDSECDLALESKGRMDISRAIISLRDRLLAEHLKAEPERIAAERERAGSLLGAIRMLDEDGARLVPVESSDDALADGADPLTELIAESTVIDPTGPSEPERIADNVIDTETGPRRIRRAALELSAAVVVLLALAALWRWGPLHDLVAPDNLQVWGAALRETWWGMAATFLAYLVGGLVMVPVVALITITAVVFGPLVGFPLALVSSVASGVLGYWLGARLGRQRLRQLTGTRLDRVSRALAHRGLLSIIILRILPVAPFTVINCAAGASHIRFRDFLLGTVIGMAPGILAMTALADRILEAVRDPNLVNLLLLVATLVVIGLAVAWVMRRFGRPGRNPDSVGRQSTP